MCLTCTFVGKADVQQLRDRFVGQSLREQVVNLAFARGQIGCPLGGPGHSKTEAACE